MGAAAPKRSLRQLDRVRGAAAVQRWSYVEVVAAAAARILIVWRLEVLIYGLGGASVVKSGARGRKPPPSPRDDPRGRSLVSRRSLTAREEGSGDVG